MVAIVTEREQKGPYKNLFDLTKRVSSRSLNKKAAESLAAAGAFDCFEGTHRAQYFAVLPGETITAIEKSIKNAAADQARAM